VTKQHGLTAIAVTRAKAKRDKAGRAVRTERPDPACRGLYLILQPSGARSWAIRYRTGGRTKKLTLGPVLDAGEVAGAPEPRIGQALTNPNGAKSNEISHVIPGTGFDTKETITPMAISNVRPATNCR
jgi:hypothetical protein